MVLVLAVALWATPVQKRLEHALPRANDAAKAYRHLEKTAATFPGRERAFFVARVAANLEEKEADEARQGSPLGLSEREVEREVVDFEAFKLRTYLSSGVFPKRYFGYFDERWDTAALERELKDVVSAAVRLANEDAALRGGPVRITDDEVAVTFVAEGGALLLRERQDELAHILPVQDVGMDDVVAIFAAHPALVARLDEALGTHLRSVVGAAGLQRTMTYREALAAITVAWLYEKERAARMLEASGGGRLADRSADEQFVIASLVYNSGVLFAPPRIALVRDFTAGPYLAVVSRENAKKRWPLPVASPAEALGGLLAAGAYPDQPTSWSAVYHVLQRYGARTALRRFSDVFDARGTFVRPPARP